jgi:hypothetical protein
LQNNKIAKQETLACLQIKTITGKRQEVYIVFAYCRELSVITCGKGGAAT